MKIALYSQKKDIDTFLYLSKVISELSKLGAEVCIHEDTFQDLEFCSTFSTFRDRQDLENQKVDYFFSFGGDGTILYALTFIQDLEIPVVGINMGRLGFLAHFSKEDIFQHIPAILRGDLNKSSRSVIQLETTVGKLDFPYAINDVSVTRHETTSMITVDSYINGKFLNVFWADGLIISTPTGSTAYSLSCGGPIISPRNDNFCISPIAPHNLNVRPLVLKDDAVIRLKIQSRVPRYSLSLDSRLYHMSTDDELLIYKAPFELILIQPQGFSFFETIRQKLGWGKDQRN